MEDQLAAPGLALNAVVLFNTLYIACIPPGWPGHKPAARRPKATDHAGRARVSGHPPVQLADAAARPLLPCVQN
jgi:hypothetical protein